MAEVWGACFGRACGDESYVQGILVGVLLMVGMLVLVIVGIMMSNDSLWRPREGAI